LPSGPDTDAATCRTITAEPAFAALAESWDRLVRAMPRPCPHLLHGWLDEWWRRYGTSAEVAVHVAYRGGALVAALPLMVRRRRGLRVAEFLGDSGYGVPLADVLVAADEAPATVSALVRHAAARYDCVDLRDVPARSRLAAVADGGCRLLERLAAPVIDVGAGGIAARMRPDDRRELGRLRRRLAELGTVEVSVARDREGLRIALHEGLHLHALRWEGRFDGSGFATPAGRCFEEAALLRLAEHDVPRIVTLRLDGRPIAFNYYFALAGRMIGYRTAFDPALARFAPGRLGLVEAIEAAAAEGLQTVELLGGAERLKTDLADRTEPLHELCGLAASTRGRAWVGWRVASIRLRTRLKRSPTFRRWYHAGRDRAQRLGEALGRRSAPAPG
jgi:CelD/BcsL family acetyltransferase involved in cellulose biosynthesis